MTAPSWSSTLSNPGPATPSTKSPYTWAGPSQACSLQPVSWPFLTCWTSGPLRQSTGAWTAASPAIDLQRPAAGRVTSRGRPASSLAGKPRAWTAVRSAMHRRPTPTPGVGPVSMLIGDQPDGKTAAESHPLRKQNQIAYQVWVTRQQRAPCEECGAFANFPCRDSLGAVLPPHAARWGNVPPKRELLR